MKNECGWTAWVKWMKANDVMGCGREWGVLTAVKIKGTKLNEWIQLNIIKVQEEKTLNWIGWMKDRKQIKWMKVKGFRAKWVGGLHVKSAIMLKIKGIGMNEMK